MPNEDEMLNEEWTQSVEIRDGSYYVTRIIENIVAPRTKWDFLSEGEKREYSLTPFQNGEGECSECGQALPTEAACAKHFIIPDVRYLNLGYCPNAKKEY